MNSQHTPGPWIAANTIGNKGRILRNWGIFRAGTDKGERIATIAQAPTTEEEAANARLIALAPDFAYHANDLVACEAYVQSLPDNLNKRQLLSIIQKVAELL